MYSNPQIDRKDGYNEIIRRISSIPSWKHGYIIFGLLYVTIYVHIYICSNIYIYVQIYIYIHIYIYISHII